MSNKKKDLYSPHLDNSKHDFFLQNIIETGFPLEKTEFTYHREGQVGGGRYMYPDHDGNIRFQVPDIITGDLEVYQHGEPPRQKIRDWYLTRWVNPKNENGEEAKYTPPKGAGVRLCFTPPVIEAFNKKKAIDTIYVIEGFKKAFAGWIYGNLPIVGMNGLTGYKEPNKDRIRSELKEVLRTCKVKRVVVLFDGDLFNLSNNKKTAHTKRPNIFYRAAITAKTLFEPYADCYLAYPHPDENNKMGLDDLLLTYRDVSKLSSPSGVDIPKEVEYNWEKEDRQKKIVNDLKNAVNKNNKGSYFGVHKLTALSDFKIKSLWHLQDVQTFFDKHREVLIPQKRFKFFTYVYELQPDGTIAQAEDQTGRELQMEVRGGKLHRWDAKGQLKEIANFTMKVLFQIESENEPKRICEIRNFENVTRMIEVNAKTFVSLADFQALMIGYGNFIWKGSKDDLLDLMTVLFRHEKPGKQIDQLGWQPIDGFYAFSNGIVTPSGYLPVDEYGMISHNETNYYLPAWSKLNARYYDEWKDVRKFSHIPSQKPVAFSKWQRQFSNVYGDNGQIAFCFYVASLFSDIVFGHRSGIGFPLLWSAGKPQTGKSSICEAILQMFGEPGEAIGLAGASTNKYLFSRFGQVRNGLVFCDEYSNTKVDKKVKEILKNIFDRIGYGKKAFSNDTRTISSPILSAAVVAGEEIPTDNHALFTRSIMLMHNKVHFTQEEREAFKSLGKMEERGLTHITVDLLRHRQLIEDNFDNVYDEVFGDIFKHYKGVKMEDRLIKNSAWIITPVKILADNNKIDLDISYEDLLKVFFGNMERQARLVQGSTDISKFWDIVEDLYGKRLISERQGHFRFMDNGQNLAIRLNRIHMAYNEQANKLGYAKVLDKHTLENYLTSEPYYVEETNSKGKRKKVRFSGSAGPSIAHIFRYDDLGIDLMSDPTREDEFKQSDKLGCAVEEVKEPEKRPDAEQQDLPY